jgi:hypothetical protein
MNGMFFEWRPSRSQYKELYFSILWSYIHKTIPIGTSHFHIINGRVSLDTHVQVCPSAHVDLAVLVPRTKQHSCHNQIIHLDSQMLYVSIMYRAYPQSSMVPVPANNVPLVLALSTPLEMYHVNNFAKDHAKFLHVQLDANI